MRPATPCWAAAAAPSATTTPRQRLLHLGRRRMTPATAPLPDCLRDPQPAGPPLRPGPGDDERRLSRRPSVRRRPARLDSDTLPIRATTLASVRPVHEAAAHGSSRSCASPDRAIVAVLLYGPDHGLVRERADRLVSAVAGDANDPFRIAELSADAMKDDTAAPGRRGGCHPLLRRAPRRPYP